MANFNPKEEVCATCTYWQGERTFKRVGHIVHVKDGEKAPCHFSKKKLFFHDKHTPQHTCDEWKLWNALK